MRISLYPFLHLSTYSPPWVYTRTMKSVQTLPVSSAFYPFKFATPLPQWWEAGLPLSSIYLFTCLMPHYVDNLQTPPSGQGTRKLPSRGLQPRQAILPVHTNALLNQRCGSWHLLTSWTTLRSGCKLPALSSENVYKEIHTKICGNFKSFTLVALWHWAVYLNFGDFFFFKYTSGAIKSVPSKKMD